jgi:hypothetical protein
VRFAAHLAAQVVYVSDVEKKNAMLEAEALVLRRHRTAAADGNATATCSTAARRIQALEDDVHSLSLQLARAEQPGLSAHAAGAGDADSIVASAERRVDQLAAALAAEREAHESSSLAARRLETRCAVQESEIKMLRAQLGPAAATKPDSGAPA